MKSIFTSTVFIFIFQFAIGQHDMHHMQHPADTVMVEEDTMKHSEMNHAYSLSLPMNRNGSGTAWLPDTSTMYGYMAHKGKWMFMLHDNIFLRYNKQDLTNKGNQGGEKLDAPAWLMFMGQRKIRNRGLFHFSSMISLDPFTVGNDGYPLLFQTGETYKGSRLVNRQHPHDLFSELSLAYTHMFSKNIDLTAYLGYPGEPALGPVAFMHRLSALNNPDAPLSHHWQDATHIDFGVATLGLRLGIFKIEGSTFTGREPDENRYNFDTPKFDSYSLRIACNPTKQLAIQISHAYLENPEAVESSENTRRTTASLIHHFTFQKDNSYLSTAIIWGHNEGHLKENSLLIEPTLQLDKTAIYGRYEWVQKDAIELDLKQYINGSVALFNIQALTLGINHTFLKNKYFSSSLGFQGSVFTADSRLDYLYGKYPLSGEVYIRISPPSMDMHGNTKQKKHTH